MARAYYINGQCLVSYNGSELGLSDGNGRVTIRPIMNHMEIDVDGWKNMPPERQIFPLGLDVSMTLVHFDISVLQTAMVNSTQGVVEGRNARGGVLLGANGGYGTLTLSSPGPAAKPVTVSSVYIKDQYELPLGAERSLLSIVWRSVGYVADPYNSGNGSLGTTVYSY